VSERTLRAVKKPTKVHAKNVEDLWMALILPVIDLQTAQLTRTISPDFKTTIKG
jgi:hypothetical protein